MVDPIMQTLRARRRALEISQDAIGAALGVNRVTISRWESGERTPRISQLRCYALAVDAEIHIEIKGRSDG